MVGVRHGTSRIGERSCTQMHPLGRDLAGPNGTGDVVSPTRQEARQCPGVPGSGPGSSELPSLVVRQACPSEVRQHLGCLLCQSSRRDKVMEVVVLDSPAPDLGGPALYQPEGGMHSRPAERTRMDASPGGCKLHLADLSPLSFQRGSLLSPLVLPDRLYQSSGPQCTGTPLAPGFPLCFSLVRAYLSTSPEGYSGGSSWWPPSGQRGLGFICCTGFAPARRFAFPPGGTSCPSLGVWFSTQSRVASSSGFYPCRAKPFFQYREEVGRTMASA
ncbi:hypothetical protein AMECASPLE_019321 [Ameca splendens]|uniref:Uncharacterized protein n=1 Tax=Ameca splendens TaxID=208324 RepID=A0ABV0YQA8_9TELE